MVYTFIIAELAVFTAMIVGIIRWNESINSLSGVNAFCRKGIRLNTI